jgi:hypothetical protein
MDPPPDLGDRVVVAARAERAAPDPVAPPPAPRLRRLARLVTPSRGAALAGVATAIVLAVVAAGQHDSASDARSRTDALAGILAAPEARVVRLSASGGGATVGRVVVAGRRAAIVTALDPPPAGRTYQAWGIPPGEGAPVPLPTFAGRRAVLVLDGADRYAEVAVSVEPRGGSRAPTTTPFAAARLDGAQD